MEFVGLGEFLMGLLSFVLFFGVSAGYLFVFKLVYTHVTPHDEWKLIKEDKNVSAGVAFAGAILGFCIALGGAATNSVNLIDFTVWAGVALVAQIVAFFVAQLSMPRIVERIEADEMAAAVVLAAISIGLGVVNAACMSY